MQVELLEAADGVRRGRRLSRQLTSIDDDLARRGYSC